MFTSIVRALGPTGAGVALGAATGALLGAPTLMHELRSHDDRPHTYTALAGLAANLLIPSALLIAGGKHPNPSVFRSASFGAAAGVTGAWWGMRSLGELK